MLRIPKSVDYGVLILVTLFEERDQLLNAKAIAKRCGVSHQQVAKILKAFHKNGLVESKQGAHGGYKLSQPEGQITLEQVYCALEGPLSFAECTDPQASDKVQGCKVDHKCTFKPHLQALNEAILAVCRNLTIRDVSQKPKTKEELIFPVGVAL